MENIKSIISEEIKAIQNIPIDGSFENAVELIHEQVHQKNGNIETFAIVERIP